MKISHIWNIGIGAVIPSLCKRKLINRSELKRLKVDPDASPCRFCIAADIKDKIRKRERELKRV